MCLDSPDRSSELQAATLYPIDPSRRDAMTERYQAVQDGCHACLQLAGTCGFFVEYNFCSIVVLERLGVDDIALVLQENRLGWYGHVLRKDEDDWVKKCMEHEVKGSRPRGRPKKTWKEVVREDCQARKLNKEDVMDHCKWRKVIKVAR